MSCYVLVHGGKNTGEVWDKVAPLLQQHKNKVLCPTLSSPYKSTLQDHIDEVCLLIRGLLRTDKIRGICYKEEKQLTRLL